MILNKQIERKNMDSILNSGLLKKTGLGLIALMLVLGSYAIVPPGNKGIVIRAGKTSDTVLDEGFTLKLPFITTVKAVSVRIQETKITTEAASKDMQKVHTVLSLNWHISPDKVNVVFKTIGEIEVIESNIIDKQVSEVLKAATATLSAEEILAKRNELKARIDKDLVEKLAKFNLTVDNVNLSDFDFTREFNQAVENKQIAEQRSKQAEYEAQRATVDARAAVNKARGEAEANLAIAKASAEATLVQARADAESNALKQKTITDQLIRYETVMKWDGASPTVVSGGNGGGLLINLGDVSKTKSVKSTEVTDTKSEE